MRHAYSAKFLTYVCRSHVHFRSQLLVSEVDSKVGGAGVVLLEGLYQVALLLQGCLRSLYCQLPGLLLLDKLLALQGSLRCEGDKGRECAANCSPHSHVRGSSPSASPTSAPCFSSAAHMVPCSEAQARA